MDIPAFVNYLVIGSYLFGAAVWMFVYKELKGVRRDLGDLKLEMTRESALRVGQDHEARIARLERAMMNAAVLKAAENT